MSSFSDPDDERAAFLDSGTIKHGSQRRHSNRILTICNAVFFLISLSLFSTWLYETRIKKNAQLRQVSSYSPLLDQLNLPLQLQTINGTLYTPKKNAPLARQKPNPAADATWEEWELTRVYPVSAAQIRAMGKDPSTAAKLEDEVWGLGDDAYAAILDVYHQVHCLNTLRKLVYPDYYPAHAWGNVTDPRAMFETHMEHCVDILLQALQCSGNVNLITLHWVETEPWPYPDMSVERKCVDFEALTRWRLENTVDMDKYNEAMDKPAGVKELKAPDGKYENFWPGRANPNHPGGANPDEDFNL